ncbi:hypothetical protein PSP6_160160 [Paraburkholderia tropica]|nr:hypothetical protein PSP6_160160 [Paraburkholderia tropica]
MPPALSASLRAPYCLDSSTFSVLSCGAAIDGGQSSDPLTLLKMMFFHSLIRKSGKGGGIGRWSEFSSVGSPGNAAVAAPKRQSSSNT